MSAAAASRPAPNPPSLRPPRTRTSPARAALLLACLFLFRLGIGLSSTFWSADERMTYLTGLRAFARGIWPFFGADVVWTNTRLPGALQGGLIAAPWFVLPIPEGPFVLLNLFSFAALAALAWYVERRAPRLPRWFVWGTLMTLPWTLNFSTHVVNTSYILPGAIVFFLGFFEAVPALACGALRPAAGYAAMGAGLVWVLQIHMSWALLPAYVLTAFAWAARSGRAIAARAAWLAAGALVPGALLIPTILGAGSAAAAEISRTVEWHARSPRLILDTLARFLSFPSFEINRFVGQSFPDRLLFFTTHCWLAPLALVLLIAGTVQPIALLLLGVGARPRDARAPSSWNALRLTAAATVLWISASYFFSVREPQAHAFYVTFPVAAIYAMGAWERWADDRRFRTAAAVLLGVNAVFWAGMAVARGPDRWLYRHRDVVSAAIATHEDRLLGDRRWPEDRVAAVEPPDPPLPPALAHAIPTADLRVVDSIWSRRVADSVSCFDVTVENRGRDAAYIDLQYLTRYFDAANHEIGRGEGVLGDVIEPQERRRWPQLVDGRGDPHAVRATFEIVAAQTAVPKR